jgi:hypothetical protein
MSAGVQALTRSVQQNVASRPQTLEALATKRQEKLCTRADRQGGDPVKERIEMNGQASLKT